MSAINASLWQKELNGAEISDERGQWLLKAHRLVQAFKAVLGEVVIDKLQQVRAKPFMDEAAVLGLSNEEAHIRQVVIASQSGHPLCYARVIIPDVTYETQAQAFSNLGRQFIGDSLLYNNKEVVRQAFEFACFGADSDYVKAFFDLNPETVVKEKSWPARRSVFLWRECPLLITEFLLPYLAKVPYPQ